MGWRRGLIRFVLACNWCVAGLAFGLGFYPHFIEWHFTARHLVQADQGKPGRDDQVWNKNDEPRAEHYRQLTYPLYRSGRNAWLWVSGTSAVSAVLLMIAFPKKTPPPPMSNPTHTINP